MLHSVAGAEFFDFIWQHGRPSSFPILMVTFVITLAFMYFYGFRRNRYCQPAEGAASSRPTSRIRRLPGSSAAGMFLLTVLAMAFREVLGVKLGFIALTGAVITVLIIEIMGEKLKEAPSFEHIVQELDWRAVFLYIALFALVGGLEEQHPRHAGQLDEADVRPELRARRYRAVLGHHPDRRYRQATTPTS